MVRNLHLIFLSRTATDTMIWDVEHQYSMTVIQRPQPTRRRVRSILWQHPLKRKGGQFNLHETAQEQRRNQQGAEVSRQGDRAHQEESQPIREEHEQKAAQYSKFYDRGAPIPEFTQILGSKFRCIEMNVSLTTTQSRCKFPSPTSTPYRI